MEEEVSNDIVLCGCVRCKFETRRRSWIVEDHVSKYGAEDIGQYNASIDAHLQVQGHITQPNMMPNIRASSMHHREARKQAMAG